MNCTLHRVHGLEELGGVVIRSSQIDVHVDREEDVVAVVISIGNHRLRVLVPDDA